MFENLTDAIQSLMDAIGDAVSSLADVLAEAVAWYLDWMERAVNAVTNAVAHAGVPRSERIELTCGGHVNIDYYVRNPG